MSTYRSTKPHNPPSSSSTPNSSSTSSPNCCPPPLRVTSPRPSSAPSPSPRAPSLTSPFPSPRSATALTSPVLTTFYRRPLPASTCIAFSSPEGRQLFTEALAAGGMGCFFPLIEHFHTQSDPAYCGLGSLTMCLNALQIDPGRAWKGPWRWFDESLLDCCEPLEVVQTQGISLLKAHCLARCKT